MAKILVIDDERLARVLCKQACTRQGHEVYEAGTLADGMEMAGKGMDLIFLDVMLPDGDGISQVANFTAMPGSPEVLIVTGFGDGEGAAGALESGALDYLVKPLQLRDIEQVTERVLSWREQKFSRVHELDCPELIGKSKALLEVLQRTAEAAQSDVNVLLLGETGVGKELFARAVHRNSGRKNAACVTLDCASLPPTLMAAQLFGHAKGAFTGADRAREGLLKLADKGTLFMDEVGELPLDVQGAFLRALDVRKFRPVGEKEEAASDFRLVAATNKNLADMAEKGSFRGDLLYRLRGMTIIIPPLRQRREDIPLLADFFLERAAVNLHTEKKIAAQDLLDMLMAYSWPGNVREFGHVVQNAAILAGSAETVHAHHLPKEIKIAVSRQKFGTANKLVSAASLELPEREEPACERKTGSAFELFTEELPTLKECRGKVEAAYLDELLKRTSHDITRAAKVAGVSRGHLYELMRKHGR